MDITSFIINNLMWSVALFYLWFKILHLEKRMDDYNKKSRDYYERQTQQWLEMQEYHNQRYDELMAKIGFIRGHLVI